MLYFPLALSLLHITYDICNTSITPPFNHLSNADSIFAYIQGCSLIASSQAYPLFHKCSETVSFNQCYPSFIGPMTQCSFIGPMTQHSFIGPMTQHGSYGLLTKHEICPMTQILGDIKNFIYKSQYSIHCQSAMCSSLPSLLLQKSIHPIP